VASQLDKKFEKLVDGVVKVEKQKAEAAQKQSDPKPWMNFASEDIPSDQRPTEKKEKQLEEKTFDRKKANETYVEARGDEEAKSQDAAVAKLAGDFFGACVRDKRQQWRSRIRQLAHGFASDAGNGDEAGPLRRNTVDYLQRIFLKSREEKKSVS
jgi:hypothetical protein